MKKILLLFCLMAITTVNAQKADYRAFPTELRAENNVFEVSGKNASELYQLTKSWAALNYVNPQRVIVFDDENTTIKIRHFFDIDTKVLHPKKVKVKYHLQFDFKDDKVRVMFSEIGDTHYTKYTKFFDEYGSPKKSKSVNKSIITLENYVSKFVDDYIYYLQKGNDW